MAQSSPRPSSKATMSARKGALLWFSLTLTLVVIIVLALHLFHQQVVPSHTHDPHPVVAASTDVFWADSERLKLGAASYNYVSPPFTPDESAAYFGHWTCYPGGADAPADYTLNIILTDARTHAEQSALIACNTIAPTSGVSTVELTGADSYTVTIQSAGPWTFSIGRS